MAEEESGVWLHWIKDERRKQRVADVTLESTTRQAEYKPYREEVSQWVRSQHSAQDGVPFSQWGISSFNYWMGNFTRSGNWLRAAAERRGHVIRSTPVSQRSRTEDRH